MFSKLAYGFGAAFVLIGLLGFCARVIFDGMLFGYFAVDMVHNFAHIATGALGLFAGYVGNSYSKMYFQFLAVGYALVGAAGIYFGSEPIFGLMANNMADVVLHFGIAATAFCIVYCCALCCKE